jgi:RNA polymerase sigma-70 factor (ECF subfamily)
MWDALCEIERDSFNEKHPIRVQQLYEMHTGELTLAIPQVERRPNFDELMAAHQQRVLRTAYRLLGRLEDAQDVCQEAFLRLYKNYDSLDSQPQAWLYRVTVNLCNDHFRRTRRLEPVEFEPPDPGPSAIHSLEQEDRKRLLTAGLRRLSERERSAIVLRDIEGLPTPEVAAILGVEEVTVRGQCATARQKLAQYVRRHA